MTIVRSHGKKLEPLSPIFILILFGSEHFLCAFREDKQNSLLQRDWKISLLQRDWSYFGYEKKLFISYTMIQAIQGVSLEGNPKRWSFDLIRQVEMERNTDTTYLCLWKMGDDAPMCCGCHHICWKCPPWASKHNWSQRCIYLKGGSQNLRRHCLDLHP